MTGREMTYPETGRKTGTRKIGGRNTGRQVAGSQATGGHTDRRHKDRQCFSSDLSHSVWCFFVGILLYIKGERRISVVEPEPEAEP